MTYRLTSLDSSFITNHGSIETPIITLADEYGGRSQIAIDDGCYVLYNWAYKSGCYFAVIHWYKEAMNALHIYPKIKKYYKLGLLETIEFLDLTS